MAEQEFSATNSSLYSKAIVLDRAGNTVTVVKIKNRKNPRGVTLTMEL